MKYYTIIFLFISINCLSQIKIEEPEENINNSQPLKPVIVENIDLNEYKKAEQFLGLIGRELLYLPRNSKYKLGYDDYESISFIPKEKLKLNKEKYKRNTLVQMDRSRKELFDYLEIEGNYFIVDSIQFYDSSFDWRKRITGLDFKENQKKLASDYSFFGSIDIYTHHKKTNKIIIFNIADKNDSEKLISVSYFNYLTLEYLDKKVILKKRGYENYRENEELSSYNRKVLDSTQIFDVTKIVLTEPKTEYYEYYTPVFYLKNLENDIKEFAYYKIKDDLIFLDEFNIQADLKEERDLILMDSLKRVRIANEKLRKEQVELRKAKNKKIRKERLERYVKKYGKDDGETIANYKVRIGMTKQMCEDSWGKPESINKTTNSYGTSEQWVYGDGNYLYFDNEKLTSIQN